MALTITLPGDHPSQDGIVAGVQFSGGKARVDDIGPNTATYLEGIGARLRHQKPPKDPQDGEG